MVLPSRLLDKTEPKQTDPAGEGKRRGSAEEGGVAEADLFPKQPQPGWPYIGLPGPQRAQGPGPPRLVTALRPAGAGPLLLLQAVVLLPSRRVQSWC